MVVLDRSRTGAEERGRVQVSVNREGAATPAVAHLVEAADSGEQKAAREPSQIGEYIFREWRPGLTLRSQLIYPRYVYIALPWLPCLT